MTTTACRRLSSFIMSIALVMLFAGAAAAADSFIYAVTQVTGAANQIYGYRINAAGTLTALAGFPVASGGIGGAGSFSETIKYANGHLYVINDGDHTLGAFSVNPVTGALAPLLFSPIALGSGSWGCVDVHPTGSPVVVGGSAGLASIMITESMAVQAVGSPFATTGSSPFSCTFSRDGNYVYTGGNVGSTIAGFSVNATTGVLTALAGSPFNSGGGNPVGYATDTSGRIFVSNFGTAVRAFTTSSGVPTGVSGNPFPTGGLTGGVAGVIHPAGFYMVADRSGNKVGVYRIAGSGAATTLAGVVGSPFAAGGTFTGALTLARNGAFLVAANGISRNLQVFQVNANTGALASVTLQPANTLGASGLVTGVTFAGRSPQGDFDGDGSSDVAVFRPSTGYWFIRGVTTAAWGGGADVPMVGDYDGDGRSDIAVFRPSTAAWFILLSSGGFVSTPFGGVGDLPVPGDYDGDGRTDIAVFRPSTGQWFIILSSTGLPAPVTVWGGGADIPVPRDYDGDGKTDIAAYRPSTGQWFILSSITGVGSVTTWGGGADIPVAADYDGDGRADIGVFRPSTGVWFILGSNTGVGSVTLWGGGADIPVPGDFDGDGKTDIAAYRPSSGDWFILESSTGVGGVVNWGGTADIPVLRRP